MCVCVCVEIWDWCVCVCVCGYRCKYIVYIISFYCFVWVITVQVPFQAWSWCQSAVFFVSTPAFPLISECLQHILDVSFDRNLFNKNKPNVKTSKQTVKQVASFEIFVRNIFVEFWGYFCWHVPHLYWHRKWSHSPLDQSTRLFKLCSLSLVNIQGSWCCYPMKEQTVHT